MSSEKKVLLKNHKIIVVGDTNVGKTTVLNNYAYGFKKRDYASTVGADFIVTQKTTKKGELFQLQLWDVTGQEVFRSMVKLFYKGIVGAIIMFDVTNRTSFESVSYWIKNIRKNTSNHYSLPIPVMLVAVVKTHDLTEQQIQDPLEHTQALKEQIQAIQKERTIPEAESSEFADKNNMLYREIYINHVSKIDEMFETLLESISKKNLREKIIEDALQHNNCCNLM
jgi:small GTP-binding protein